MQVSVIIAIVIAGFLVGMALVWLGVSWYTWRKLSKLNPHMPLVPIDIQEYKGKWYEIARNPSLFEKGCSQAIAEYTPKPGYIQVKNHCIKNGKTQTSIGKAFATENKAVLGVSFFPGIYGNYSVVYRDPTTSIVSEPNKKYLWILSRTPSISKRKQSQVMSWLKEHHFDLKRLEFPSVAQKVKINGD